MGPEDWGVRDTVWTQLSTFSMTLVSPCLPSLEALCLEKSPTPDVPPMSMALRFRALMMFTMMELAEGL